MPSAEIGESARSEWHCREQKHKSGRLVFLSNDSRLHPNLPRNQAKRPLIFTAQAVR